MKILHVIPSYFPAIKYGGPVESVHLLNKVLAKRGINVFVFTTNAGINDFRTNDLNKWIELDGIKVKYFKSYFYEHFTFSPLMLISLVNEVKSYDLIHITGVWNFPVFAASLACIINKKPFIISPRGVLYKDAINIKSKFIKLLYFNIFARHYLKKANAIHYTTTDEKEHIFHNVNKKSIVIPNGIDLKTFDILPEKGAFKNKYPALNSKKYILFLGRVNKQKGLLFLIKAFQKLINEFKDLYLVIAGPDDGFQPYLESEIRRLNLEKRVLFTGMLSGKDKLSAYIDAEIFILPSYFENFSMSTTEAMACGLPVIISNKVGIYKEIKESQAGIVSEVEAESIYQSIINLLHNPEQISLLRNNAKKLIKEKYDINNVADMMINAYTEII